MPQVAMAHDGSCVNTSRNVFSPALYQNECSIATPRSNCACTLASQEFGKLTLPSFSSCVSAGTANAKRNKKITAANLLFI